MRSHMVLKFCRDLHPHHPTWQTPRCTTYRPVHRLARCPVPFHTSYPDAMMPLRLPAPCRHFPPAPSVSFGTFPLDCVVSVHDGAFQPASSLCDPAWPHLVDQLA